MCSARQPACAAKVADGRESEIQDHPVRAVANAGRCTRCITAIRNVKHPAVQALSDGKRSHQVAAPLRREIDPAEISQAQRQAASKHRPHAPAFLTYPSRPHFRRTSVAFRPPDRANACTTSSRLKTRCVCRKVLVSMARQNACRFLRLLGVYSPT